MNQTMVNAYWLVGRRIVEEDQAGESRATYGKAVIKKLSDALQREFCKGFSARNLEQMRAFYLSYPIPQTLSAELHTPDFQLSWSHYQMLTRIKDKEERAFYEIESIQNQWGLREMKRQQIFASRYQTVLPSKEELRKLLEDRSSGDDL